MNSIEAIEKISKATNFGELKADYKNLMKLMHPDLCKTPGAEDAASRLGELKMEWTKGIKYEDESGVFYSKGLESVYEGDPVLLKKSLANYKKLMSLNTDRDKIFHKYLPESMEMRGDKLHVTFRKRAVPLAALKKLEQIHVNWLVSRILEVATWLNTAGISHNGLNLESVYVTPEDHGIQIGSFYMVSRLDEKLKGVSGRYKTWYPPSIFKHKTTASSIDVTLIKKIGICLLGDKSGVGTKLRRDSDVNQEMLTFFIEHSQDPKSAYLTYRRLLSKLFTRKFHELKI